MAASPTLNTIRAAIVSAIKSALNSSTPSSVLVVHDYRRFWRDEQKFQSLFKRTDTGGDMPAGTINGWMVTRVSTREVEASEWWRFQNIHRFEMQGYCGVQDAAGSNATEKVFQDQIEKIRDNLRLNFSVWATTEASNPVTQVISVSPMTLGESTCWNAILECDVEALETKFS